jgi:four helix bundle protein
VKDSIVKNKSYAFAVNVVRLARELRQRHEFELSKQVLRSGASIGANIEEALAGISRRDFTAKMGIASKEARETHYWLRLIQDSESITSNAVLPMLRDVEELLRILTAIVKTSQNGTLQETKHSKLKTKNFKEVYV